MSIFLSGLGLRLSIIGIATLMGLSVWGWIYSNGIAAGVQRVERQEKRKNDKARAARNRAGNDPSGVLKRYTRD